MAIKAVLCVLQGRTYPSSMHLHYEDVAPCPEVTVSDGESGFYDVSQMRFPLKAYEYVAKQRAPSSTSLFDVSPWREDKTLIVAREDYVPHIFRIEPEASLLPGSGRIQK